MKITQRIKNLWILSGLELNETKKEEEIPKEKMAELIDFRSDEQKLKDSLKI